ncbi:P-type conjugative transfer protein TrbL [Sulfuricurvum sp.]|uniref:P-type conjugative transfer protein TrbL n=1 Tax=Sulfuricurvum sp. TaxID=2025608 RepID=UPI0026160B85|nr:P-type conjugative transfer protein TrbL [Sulfuricurvum sp.]MDD4883056.1 P-type conjugative transfer protein TrbL [Sulfuricurvum sp.]
MKKIILLLLLPVFIFAAVSPDYQTQSLLSGFETASTTWNSSFLAAAKYVFFSLVVIDFVIEFGFLALTGNLDFGSIFAPLIRKILTIGFFLMLFEHSDWIATIPKSLSQLGNTAGSSAVEVDSIFNYGIDIVADLWSRVSLLHLADAVLIAFTGIVLIIAFSLMAANLALTTIKMYAILAVAPLVFSLGGLGQTRQMAYNPIFAIIKVGMELLFLKLFLGLMITKMHEFAANVDTDNNSILTMTAMAVLMVSVVQMIPGFVESLLSGTLGSNSTAGFSTAAGVAGGMASGAMGAAGGISAVKAAASLAGSQGATGLGRVSQTMKNLGSSAMNDIGRSMAGQNRGGSMGGRMANEMKEGNFAHSAVNATKKE